MSQIFSLQFDADTTAMGEYCSSIRLQKGFMQPFNVNDNGMYFLRWSHYVAKHSKAYVTSRVSYQYLLILDDVIAILRNEQTRSMDRVDYKSS